MTVITQPGFYPNITPEQYFAEPCPAMALTNSGIKMLLASCPAKFLSDRNMDRRATAAQDRGSLVHRLALGKGADYAISPFDEYRTGEAKAWRDATIDAGLIPVKQAEFAKAEAMATAIEEGIKRETRDQPYQTEVVMAWRMVIDGFPIWCRAMIDVWCPALNLALDVKTCADASDQAINNAMARGYATQAAFYADGIGAVDTRKEAGRPSFGFLFVESETPYLQRYAECDEAFRHGASFGIEKAARIFARCMKSGEWPGYERFKATPPAWWLGQAADYELEDIAA